jgi:hypothetical protein
MFYFTKQNLQTKNKEHLSETQRKGCRLVVRDRSNAHLVFRMELIGLGLWSHGEVYSIQHYVINFVSDLLQVGSFFWVLQFYPPIKLTATIVLKYC